MTLVVVSQGDVRRSDVCDSSRCITDENPLSWSAVVSCEGEFVLVCGSEFGILFLLELRMNWTLGLLKTQSSTNVGQIQVAEIYVLDGIYRVHVKRRPTEKGHPPTPSRPKFCSQ